MANSHPGSYCGQDAYNDMFVTEQHYESVFVSENKRIQGVERSFDTIGKTIQERNRPDYEGGYGIAEDSCQKTYTA